MQQVLDPFQESVTNEDGSQTYHLQDKEKPQRTEEEYRKLFDLFQKSETEEVEIDEEDDDGESRLALLVDRDAIAEADSDFSMRKMEEQLAVFIEKEDYSVVKDLRRAYNFELQRSEADRILEKIPDHAFWDIKKPQREATTERTLNKFNWNRARAFNNIFEAWEYERNMEIHNGKKNLFNAMSEYRRY